MRIFPEMCARTSWPLSSSTRNIAFGRGSVTFPSRTIASSLGLGSFRPSSRNVDDTADRRLRSARQRPVGPADQRTGPPLRSQAGLWESQDLRPVVRYGDRVFDVGGPRSCGWYHVPAVVEGHRS